MNPEPEKKSEGGEVSTAVLPGPQFTSEKSAKTWYQRFFIGFCWGLFLGFVGLIFYVQQFLPALIWGALLGLIIGGLGALFGRRFLERCIEFSSRWIS